MPDLHVYFNIKHIKVVPFWIVSIDSGSHCYFHTHKYMANGTIFSSELL